ncbi:MAG TPA: poly(R)-hydroxyalkanoic acid synthase subunit PhaE [Thermodesulfovibrionales bacterium]|nr:poly(R)-hydroxyalkanoic acid synthase subunit PhaE [Thermodesulfovibrionales bacterium]
MQKALDYFDSWLKAQEKFMEGWTETSKKMHESLASMGGSGERVKETLGVVTDTFSKLLGTSNVYVKLHEIWLPLLKAIQEKAVDPDSYKDLLDPAKYKEVLDQMFGLSSPESMANFYGEATKLLETLSDSTMGFMGPWTEAMQKNMKTMPQFVEGRPESFMNVFHNMFNAFDNTIGKVFHVPAVGKDREKVALLMRTCDDLSVNMAKNTEYQHLVYVTGLKAMEKVIETLAQKTRNGEKIKGFDEFFDLWIDVNEKTYLSVFQTEEFSKLQGELLDSTLNVRKHFFKLMELYLYDFPIALRSEMDDLYKTMYDLKKKIRTLEKKVKTFSVEEVRA